MLCHKLNCGVYKIRNKINEKVYIGSSIELSRRITQHKSDLCNDRHSNPHLQNSWNKYGKENFEFVILLYCDENYVYYYEQAFLDNIYCEYNIAENAIAPMLGKKHTKEAKIKIGNAAKGSKNAWYKTGPPKWVIDKAAKVNTGNKYNKGRVWTREQKEKASKAHKGKKLTERHKAKTGSKGVDNPSAKLTASDVIEMREIRKNTGMTYKKIGSIYGVSFSTAYDAIKRNTWRHVYTKDDYDQPKLL